MIQACTDWQCALADAARLHWQDPAEIAAAEDELLLLWSSVEKDKHTVLVRPRQQW